MVSFNWTRRTGFVWITLGMVLTVVVKVVISTCPKDVSSKVHICLTSYNFHFENMQNSPQKLCCGIDVETLRAFCQSYTSAATCVSQLEEECPEEQSIHSAMVHLYSSRAGLQELCIDDSIIESYAMYQSCFTFAGGGSERCFQIHMNYSMKTNIRLLSKVSITKMDQFCDEMRNTVDCVEKHVKTVCGDKAARLAAILVKPMVWHSTKCDYSVINKQEKSTKPAKPGQHAFISNDQGHGQKSSNGNKHISGDWRQQFVNFLTMSIVFVFLRNK